MASQYIRPGRGCVPGGSLLAAAWKELLEYQVCASTGALATGLGSQLDFTKEGIAFKEFSSFFEEAIQAAKKVEAIVESGNKYGVSPTDFTKMNGEVLFHQIKSSAQYKALSDKDQARADEIFSLMCFSSDLRNRNPLHPNPLDTAVVSNLVNFPKHIFSFPFGSWCTNGYEALSLCLYSYRQECKLQKHNVLYVLAEGEEEPIQAISACCARLQMQFTTAKEKDLGTDVSHGQLAVVVTNFTNPALAKVADWAARAGSSVHIHVLDSQFREIFAASPDPVHFQLPDNIRSISLSEGLLDSSYLLYRDIHLRDLHMDLPLCWQTAYLSPNEGGSGNSTPLFMDFCFTLLGWSAMRDIAMNSTAEKRSEPWKPLVLGPSSATVGAVQMPQGAPFDEILSWAKDNMDKPREDLEQSLVEFQRNFVGGKKRTLEALVTSGGTRSINVAFESVLLRAKKTLGSTTNFKVIMGNPHLAVERAERRFQFQGVRVEQDGVLSVAALKLEIVDPSVIAVYTQTLSFTDGITDPLSEILDIMEDENKRRQSTNGLPVTLINDSCLALSILIHNDGQANTKSLRILDLNEGCITPIIGTLDAHKHLGADKGISMAFGTPGTLSHMSGHVRVAAAPSRGELVRAMADLSLVGVEGYYKKYHALVAALDSTLQKIEGKGMKIIHAQHRVKGSTVFSVEDPSAVMVKKLKKKGHVAAPIYEVCPSQPSRCQTGFQLSLTPHALREVNGKSALDIFSNDVLECHTAAQASYTTLAKMFKENSLLAFLLSGGNEEFWAMGLLRNPGLGRDLMGLMIRRVYSGILDGGVACSKRHVDALSVVAKRLLAIGVLQFFAMLFLRRRFRQRPKL